MNLHHHLTITLYCLTGGLLCWPAMGRYGVDSRSSSTLNFVFGCDPWVGLGCIYFMRNMLRGVVVDEFSIPASVVGVFYVL